MMLVFVFYGMGSMTDPFADAESRAMRNRVSIPSAALDGTLVDA
jgi:hypothetical protein